MKVNERSNLYCFEVQVKTENKNSPGPTFKELQCWNFSTLT